MKTLITALLIVCAMALNAQNGREKRQERIRTYKIGFLTEKLELTPTQAQNFWPIYNEYDGKMEDLRKSEFEVLRSTRQHSENLTEDQAEEILTTLLEVERNRADYKIALANKLKNILPVKKVLTLFKAEEDFKRRLLKELRNKRGPGPRG